MLHALRRLTAPHMAHLGTKSRADRGRRVSLAGSQSQLNLAGDCEPEVGLGSASFLRPRACNSRARNDSIPLAAMVVTRRLPPIPELDGSDKGLRLTLLRPLSPEKEVPRCNRLTVAGLGARALRKAVGERVDRRTLLPVREAIDILYV